MDGWGGWMDSNWMGEWLAEEMMAGWRNDEWRDDG